MKILISKGKVIYFLTIVSYYDTRIFTCVDSSKTEPTSMDEKEVFKNIKIIRQNKKMSLERLAKLTGLTKGYVSKIENSDKAPPFSTLIKVANALDTDISLLIAEDSEIPENINLCISIIPHSGRSLGGKKAKILAVMYSYKR